MKNLKYRWTIFLLLLLTSVLKVGNFWLSSITYPLLWIYAPFFIYTFLPSRKSQLKAILTLLVVTCYVLITIWELLGFLICGYGPTQYEYVSKQNPNFKIVGRDFSCYGTTGDLVLYKEYLIIKDIKIEIHYKTFIDYKNVKVDTTEWQRIKKY